MQYLQCVSNGDTAVLHWAIEMMIAAGWFNQTTFIVNGIRNNWLWKQILLGQFWNIDLFVNMECNTAHARSWMLCRGPNASNPARGRTLPGQERPSNGRPDASQRRPGSMLCPVGLPGALSVDILALLLYWPTYAPITVRLTSDTHVAYWQWRPEQLLCTILCTVLAYFNLLFLLRKIHK